MEILSYTARKSPMLLDIMVGDRYLRTVSMDCQAGKPYMYKALKERVREIYPSLGGADFDLLPSERRVFNIRRIAI